MRKREMPEMRSWAVGSRLRLELLTVKSPVIFTNELRVREDELTDMLTTCMGIEIVVTAMRSVTTWAVLSWK